MKNMPDSENKTPAISVVICTLNGEAVIEEAINSLVNQTLSPEKYEIVAVDNGSSDRTPEIIKSFVEKQPGRIRLIIWGIEE